MKVPSKGPVIDVLVARDGDAWRLYFAPSSWKPGTLGTADRNSIFPVARPDFAALDRFMRKAALPFERCLTADGGIEVRAKGRGAIAVAAWLSKLI
jgi:hypothetical protein